MNNIISSASSDSFASLFPIEILFVSFSCLIALIRTSSNTSYGVCLFFVTPWTIACQAPLSREFLVKDMEWIAISYSGKWIFLTQGNSWVIPMSLASPALAGRFFTTSSTWKA